MTVIQSKFSTSDSRFQKQFKIYQALEARLQDHRDQALWPYSKEQLEANQKRGKQLVGQRLELLADPGSDQLELCALAGLGVYDGVAPGAGIRTAVLKIAGRRCMVIANDPLVKGGTYFPLTVKKHLRAQEIARENALACIYLVDSGGAFLPLQAEVFADRDHFGRIFFNQANLSRSGIAQIAAVLGSCTAGGAYVPAMSDECVIVRGMGTVFLGGPPLVKAATGVEVTAEELGGAEVHCRKSGVTDHLVESEEEAIEKLRNIISYLGADRTERLQIDRSSQEPIYPVEELYGILGSAEQIPALEVIARLVDGSRFEQFKSRYGETLKCGFSHVGGYLVGIVANDGILFSESALKGAHFIELCNQRRIPLLFLQNIVGFMVGKEYEHAGIAKEGAKMVSAVSTCTVPKITLIIGGSYGAGNYAMCGRAFGARLLFAWPNSRISVMGGEQAARVLGEIKFRGQSEIASSEKEQFMQKIRESYERDGDPYYATARIWDDGLLSPLQTRKVLTVVLSMLALKETAGWNQTFYRM